MKNAYLLTALLFATLTLAGQVFAREGIPEKIEFKVTFGPWMNPSAEVRSRRVYLELTNTVIDQCWEEVYSNSSDIIKSCSFIKEDVNSGWALDEEQALTTLYHNSGMNRDGSARYFWHEWFGII